MQDKNYINPRHFNIDGGFLFAHSRRSSQGTSGAIRKSGMGFKFSMRHPIPRYNSGRELILEMLYEIFGIYKMRDAYSGDFNDAKWGKKVIFIKKNGLKTNFYYKEKYPDKIEFKEEKFVWMNPYKYSKYYLKRKQSGNL